MRLPLYLTYTTDTEPYLGYMQRLASQVKALGAGELRSLILNSDGRGRDFFAEVLAQLYAVMTVYIDARPIILLDCDLELRRPITELFNDDWDVAAVYRGHLFRRNNSGRQDFSSAFVAMNCRRPNSVRRFWMEWAYRTAAWPVYYGDRVPSSLIKRGWLASWFSDQSSLNEILLPDGPERRVREFAVYDSKGLRVLPLRAEEYTAESIWPEIKNPYIFHQKPPRGRCNVV